MFTRVQVDSNELEDFAVVIGDDTQVQRDVPAAAQPEERAAGDVQVQEVPAAAQPQELAAGDVQVQTTPAAATREELAATTHLQAEEAPDATEIIAHNVFQVEKVNPAPVGSTTLFIDSAASSHMVSTYSRLSQHAVETSDCNVRIKGSCGTSSGTKKGTLKFGICNAQDKIIPVALEVLLVKCDLSSTPPVLRHGTNSFPISTKVPRVYVVKIILNDVNLDGSAKIFRTKVDAHMWHCLLYTSPSPRD